jgi:hypothetical protein
VATSIDRFCVIIQALMKRLNPKTGKPFKHGHIREDGKVFWGYRETCLKNGQREENWMQADKFAEAVSKKEIRRKANSEYFKKYREANREKARKATRKWQITNTEKVNAYFAKRRAKKLQATPNWLTAEHHLQIEGFYLLAKEMERQLGQKYEVDHIVPLKGKTVSGLHVPWNLQILTKTENCSKNNRF